MKTKQKVAILALAALVTGTSHAAITGKSSGFMDKRQLAEWRAETAFKPAETKREDTAFFTGKPFLASTDTYSFMFRSYDPSTARWTSEDPSGFPDGANASFYAPVPTGQFDYLGLAKLDAEGGAALWGSYYNYNDFTTLQAWQRAGGWLLENHLSGDPDWYNSCAVRLSIGLNGSGNNIAAGPSSNLSVGDRYIISASAMKTYITNDWGASDRTVTSAADITTLQADLTTYSQDLGKPIYAVAINNGHVSMISSSYTDGSFAALYDGSYNVWILE